MRKIITFLGMNSFQTLYQHGSRIYEGKVFPTVLRQFETFDQMLVCLTVSARQKTWHLLEALQDSRIIPIDIPDGRTETEIWTTFQAVIQHINQDDQVIFDITHGLRSLPFQVFLFSAYLKAAKNATIEAIYYGAYDLKDGKGIAPVIDFSPFVSLLDWTTATDQFIKTGNAQALASLLEQEGDSTAKELAQGINAIAEGLHLLRPVTVMQQSAKLPALIQAAIPTISQSVPPFGALLERVQQDYTIFGLEDPANYRLNAQAALVCQLKMIEWHTQKRQIVQALSLSREWLPSLLCYEFNLDPQLEKPNRAEMELLLAGGKIKDKGRTRESQYLAKWNLIDKRKRKLVTNLWGGDLKLANLRNDVLHAGFRKNPQNSEDILEKTKRIMNELKAIALAWKLEE